jgi:murein DD-endopeptidase MepM/ murein hydrolase activator NlpD
VPFVLRDYVFFFLKRVAVVAGIGASAIYGFDTWFQSPSDLARDRELSLLKDQLVSLNEDLSQMDAVLTDISQRDDAIYRSIFGTDPYPQHLRNPGVGGVDRSKHLKGHTWSEDLIQVTEEVAEMQRKLVAQSRSFDEVLDLARNNSELLKSIPAIQPVRNEDLKRMASGYGYRIHPIYKVRKFHYGMDFSAPTGTEIFATGDGEVILAKRSYNGFGRHVIIRHGFGYETLYAHMSEIKVKRGDRVRRGDLIGLIGSTGTSVAPHLHYEVHKDGERLNPAHFYFNDLTPEQYEELLMQSEQENQSFD